MSKEISVPHMRTYALNTPREVNEVVYDFTEHAWKKLSYYETNTRGTILTKTAVMLNDLENPEWMPSAEFLECIVTQCDVEIEILTYMVTLQNEPSDWRAKSVWDFINDLRMRSKVIYQHIRKGNISTHLFNYFYGQYQQMMALRPFTNHNVKIVKDGNEYVIGAFRYQPHSIHYLEINPFNESGENHA